MRIKSWLRKLIDGDYNDLVKANKKLEQENTKLYSDIRKIIKGDIELSVEYELKFNLADELERRLWCGETSDNTNFKGITKLN